MSITLPVDGFVHVARLVTAGFGSQLEFGFETIDDLQLAIELALRSVPPATAGRPSRSARTVGADGDRVRFRRPPVDRRFPTATGASDLLSCLERLVDSVDVTEGSTPSVVLRKNRAEVVPGV